MNRNLFIIVMVFLAIVATLLTGNIITIGDKLGQLTHVYVEYAFYITLLILAAVYLVWPVMKVHRAPEMPALSADKYENADRLRDFARQLAAHCDYIPDKKQRDKHRKELLDKITYHSAEADKLKGIISKEIDLRIKGNKDEKVKGIDNIIKEWAKTVFMITAMSQNSKFDSLAVLVINYRLISDIVMASGFRPTKPQLFWLYVRVIGTSLITYCTSEAFSNIDSVAPFDWGGDVSDHVDVAADQVEEAIDGIEDIDVDFDVTPDADVSDADGMWSTIVNGLKTIHIPGIAVEIAVQGTVNALLTLRIGYVTKAYLTEGADAFNGIENKRRIKRQALKESFIAIPSVVVKGGAAVGKTAASIIKRLF